MDTYSIRNRIPKKRKPKKAAPVPKRQAIEVQQRRQSPQPDSFTYLCNDCFQPVTLQENDDVLCGHCQSRVLRKPRTERVVCVNAI